MRNDRFAVYADMVKESVSALDVAAAMGWEVKHGRCRCPVHNGTDRNCRLYPGNRGYKCFVCGSGGDVISLVQQSMTGMSFPDVLRWFNGTFHLGIDIDSSGDEKRLKTAENALKRKAADRAFRERVEKADFDMYLAVTDALFRMEDQRDANRPRRYGEDWSSAFCEAVEVIPVLCEYAEHFAMESTVKKA